MNEPNRLVLDASAVVALIKKERGYDAIAHLLSLPGTNCLVHAINACESAYHLMRNGIPEYEAWTRIDELDIDYFDSITNDMQRRIAYLKTRYRSFALGDCIAISFAEDLGADVLATDKGFREIETDINVILAR